MAARRAGALFAFLILTSFSGCYRWEGRVYSFRHEYFPGLRLTSDHLRLKKSRLFSEKDGSCAWKTIEGYLGEKNPDDESHALTPAEEKVLLEGEDTRMFVYASER